MALDDESIGAGGRRRDRQSEIREVTTGNRLNFIRNPSWIRLEASVSRRSYGGIPFRTNILFRSNTVNISVSRPPESSY